MTATDRWARRGDRAGEGAPPLPEVMHIEAKVWRQGLGFADEIAAQAALERRSAAECLAAYIRYSKTPAYRGREGALRALRVAIESSTRAAGLRVIAGGWRPWPTT